MGEHKLVFTLLSNFYLCDMTTAVFRSNEAKVKVEFEIIHAVLLDERGLDVGSHFEAGRFGSGRFGPGCFGRSRFGCSRFGPG